MDPKEREELGKGYLGQLTEALTKHDGAAAETASRGLEKQFFMMHRALHRILTSLLPLVLERFRRHHAERFEALRGAVQSTDWDAAEGWLENIRTHHRDFHDLYANWFAELLTVFTNAYGDDELAELLRASGQGFLSDFARWDAMSPEELLKASVFLQLSHPGGKLRIEEDDEKYTLLQDPCGTGGRMLDEGKYEGEAPYARVAAARPETAGHEGLPAYCAHCTVWNTLLTAEQFGAPHWVIEHPIHSSCRIHIYKDRSRTPRQYLERLGLHKKGGRHDDP
jgi:hypothetical protein